MMLAAPANQQPTTNNYSLRIQLTINGCDKRSACHRNREPEHAPLPHDALDPRAPAVRFDETAGDREAEARSAGPGASAGVPVAIEDVVDILGGDAGAGVGHGELDGLTGPADREIDAPTIRGELH